MSERRNLSISLPPELADLVDRAAKFEHRTRSELIREALRYYFTKRVALATVSAEEARAIARGREEIERGQYVTLEQLLHDLESSSGTAG